jgi:hypothetical protein
VMASFLSQIREKRNMPWLKRGTIVYVAGDRGRVTGGDASLNVRVCFVGGRTEHCHPQWKTVYWKDGKMLADYREVQNG